MEKPLTELFYSKEHEWIRYSEGLATIGICSFKLTGIPKIDDIRLIGLVKGEVIEQNELMLTLHYRDYRIAVIAPIACRFLETNSIIEKGSWELISRSPEQEGWLFKVEPIGPGTAHLISAENYRRRYNSILTTRSNIDE